jgi:hypothetical protein
MASVQALHEVGGLLEGGVVIEVGRWLGVGVWVAVGVHSVVVGWMCCGMPGCGLGSGEYIRKRFL